MKLEIDTLLKQIDIHKRNLSDLENKKAQYGLDIPLHITRECEQEEKEVKRIEGEIRRKSDALPLKINETRTLIAAAVNEYTQLLSQLSEFENLFLSYVIFPGFQLQQMIHKRRHLEREFKRIREALKRGIYTSPQEIEDDISQTLKHAEIAFAYAGAEQPEEQFKSTNPFADLVRLDISIDETKKIALVKEFKRIVLPKVHSDTSDVPYEVFSIIFDAYKKRDYLLMEAFIIEYRGEFRLISTEDLVASVNLAIEYSREYPSVLEKIERRLAKLREDEIVQRLESKEEIQVQMKEQNREIRRAIYDEAEQILYFRNCLEDLMKSNVMQKGGN